MTIEVTPPARETAPDREGACEVCGFRPEAMTAAELVAALAGTGEAYRRALGVADRTAADRTASDRTEVPVTAVGVAAQVRDRLHAIRSRVRRLAHPTGIVVLPEILLPEIVLPGVGDISQARGGDEPPALVAQGLARNAGDLARTLGDLSGEGWLRAGVRNGARVRPIDLAREAVHDCRHGLALIDEIRRRPSRSP